MLRLSTAKPVAQAFLVILITASLQACASKTTIAADRLLGTWKVDLRPLLDAEPYYNEFVITAVRDGSFTGTFYGAPISEGRINNDWGKIRIAFVTVDGSGPYYHSATLERHSLEGLSNSTGREFLAYWTAVKE
jgi:hypothetical protein